MVRTGALAVILATAAVAAAQPADPYAGPAPVDPYGPTADPALAEQIAEQLVARAQELLDAQVYLDAKQLAVEAIVKSPKGNAAGRAQLIIRLANQQLGVKDDAPPPPTDVRPVEPPTVDDARRPIEPPVAPPEPPIREGHAAAAIHAGIFGGLIGATIGAFFDKSHPAGGAVPVAIGVGIAAAVYVPGFFTRRRWDEAQIRTVGSGSVWGGVVGGLLADVVMGANGGIVTAPGVLVGASIGSTLGAIGGGMIASDHRLTRGDVALVDTLAGIGTAGGLTIGLLMQPAQKPAYALNAVLGAIGGVVTGLVAAPKTNTTPRRMVRVAGVAALGGALPLLIFAAGHKPGEERAVGALSTLGLLGGAWLGFYLTRHLDEGADVPDRARPAVDAPPAVLGRSSNGSWQLGGLAIAPVAPLGPLGPQLAAQRGMALTVLGGAF